MRQNGKRWPPNVYVSLLNCSIASCSAPTDTRALWLSRSDSSCLLSSDRSTCRSGVRVGSAGAHDVGRHFSRPDLDILAPGIAQGHPQSGYLLYGHGDDAVPVDTARRTPGALLCRRLVLHTQTSSTGIYIGK